MKVVTKTTSSVASGSAAGCYSKSPGNVPLSTSEMSLGEFNASSTADPSTPATEASEDHETSAPFRDLHRLEVTYVTK